MESSPPHLINDSSARLFATVGSTRSVKSHSDVNGPCSARAATIIRAAVSPTFFTALSPNRILPPTTAKSQSDSFTSGGSTSMPMSWQALTYRGTRSFVFITEEISAAMYSHGWFARSHAVR